MKFVFLLFAATAFALTASNQRIIARVNSMPGRTWTAGETKFADWTPSQMKQLAALELPEVPEQVAPLANDDLPTNFDARTQWPGKIVAIRDQAHCGSCWAFALSEVMSDRFGVAGCSKGLLSPQDLVSCDYMDGGCNGGNLDSSWGWAKSKGITTDACMPYTSAQGVVAKCPTKCADGSDIVRYKAASYAHLTAAQMQQDIYKNGPIEVAFDVYQDFYNYKTGVYEHVTGSFVGGHAVKAIGWGVDNGTPYWLIANSWGTGWGENGLFRIVRGKNNCRIESLAYSGEVKC